MPTESVITERNERHTKGGRRDSCPSSCSFSAFCSCSVACLVYPLHGAVGDTDRTRCDSGIGGSSGRTGCAEAERAALGQDAPGPDGTGYGEHALQWVADFGQEAAAAQWQRLISLWRGRASCLWQVARAADCLRAGWLPGILGVSPGTRVCLCHPDRVILRGRAIHREASEKIRLGRSWPGFASCDPVGRAISRWTPPMIAGCLWGDRRAGFSAGTTT